ncbi:MAG TPA: amidohydrolase [Lacunisphaera sp.]|nr:amidohydrolase [Lacunisphaera sp.]
MNFRLPFLLAIVCALPGAARAADGVPALVANKLAADYPALEKFYIDLHLHPELSLMEEKTSAKVAAELRAAGFEVTEKFGGYGVVGVLKNSAGPTLLIRTDMDALPVLEETSLPYASKVRVTDLSGHEVPVMHACGHDIHMTVFTGTARMLAGLKDRWSGTLVFVGQPAEERVIGARAMLSAGLYRQFPKPDFALALHDESEIPAGSVATIEGFSHANVDTANITIHGIGGHGAMPYKGKDPVVLAARIILALQTIVSRELRATDPAVVTVGYIQGGTKNNIIPSEVKLGLTLRSYSDEVRAHLVSSIRRICRGEAIAAGLPDELMPEVEVNAAEGATSVYNDPVLTRRVRGAFVAWFGADQVKTFEPSMVSEDFSEYGRTVEHVPVCMFRLGALSAEKISESQRTGVPLPSLHSGKFAPVPEPTIKTGVTALTAAALEILAKK